MRHLLVSNPLEFATRDAKQIAKGALVGPLEHVEELAHLGLQLLLAPCFAPTQAEIGEDPNCECVIAPPGRLQATSGSNIGAQPLLRQRQFGYVKPGKALLGIHLEALYVIFEKNSRLFSL